MEPTEVQGQDLPPEVEPSAGGEAVVGEQPVSPGGEVEPQIDWAAEARKWQSLRDKDKAEFERKIAELEERLEQFSSPREEKQEFNPSEFDPFEISDPNTPSGKMFAELIQSQVKNALEGTVRSMQEQMALATVRSRLAAEKKWDADKIERFMEFATQPKSEIPFDKLTRIFELLEAPESGDLSSVKNTQQAPPSAGAMESASPPAPSEVDQIWNAVKAAAEQGRAF
jgi:hypothetical protein